MNITFEHGIGKNKQAVTVKGCQLSRIEDVLRQLDNICDEVIVRANDEGHITAVNAPIRMTLSGAIGPYTVDLGNA